MSRFTIWFCVFLCFTGPVCVSVVFLGLVYFLSLLLFGCQYQCNLLPGKTRSRNDLLCVEWHIKPYTLTQKLQIRNWCYAVRICVTVCHRSGQISAIFDLEFPLENYFSYISVLMPSTAGSEQGLFCLRTRHLLVNFSPPVCRTILSWNGVYPIVVSWCIDWLLCRLLNSLSETLSMMQRESSPTRQVPLPRRLKSSTKLSIKLFKLRTCLSVFVVFL